MLERHIKMLIIRSYINNFIKTKYYMFEINEYYSRLYKYSNKYTYLKS